MTVSIQTAEQGRVDVPSHAIPGVPGDVLVIAEKGEAWLSITHPPTGFAMATSRYKEDLEEIGLSFWEILSEDERDMFRTETDPQRIRPRPQAVEYLRLKEKEIRQRRRLEQEDDDEQ